MIIFTGDLYLGTKEIKIETNILSRLQEANTIISNFENVFYNSNCIKRDDKSSILTTNKEIFTKYLEIVRRRHIFVLGNNHIHDIGKIGIIETKRIIKENKCEYCGVGISEEVIKPFIFSDNGKKIALIPVSTDEPEVMSKLAGFDFEGVLDYNDDVIKNTINLVKQQVDFIIIYPHWGIEYVDYPIIQLRKKAYKWIDYGADIIIGNHSHVIQGKECYKGKYIYYSLGNFIFPNFYTKYGMKKEWNKKNNRSIILKLNFNDEIETEEIGGFFEQESLMLKESSIALKEFRLKSEPLNNNTVSFKKYYSIWLKNYYHVLKNEYSVKTRIRRLIFRKV